LKSLVGLYALEKSEKVILQSKILLGGAAWLWQNIMPVPRAFQKNGMQAVPMLLLLCNLGYSLKRSEWSHSMPGKCPGSKAFSK